MIALQGQEPHAVAIPSSRGAAEAQGGREKGRTRQVSAFPLCVSALLGEIPKPSLGSVRAEYNRDMRHTDAISIDPDVQGGTTCFAGTRVPVRSLFDALKRGRTVDYFLSQFPSVTPEQVTAVLDRASEMLVVAGERE